MVHRAFILWSTVWLLCACAQARAADPLPDGRAYEPVSPVGEEGAGQVFVPLQKAGQVYLSDFGEHGVITHRPFEVAGDGGEVIYAGDPPHTGGTGNAHATSGSPVLARRLPDGGWTPNDIHPQTALEPETSAEYLAFSSDLSVGIVNSQVPLGSGGPGGFYLDLYLHRTATSGDPYVPVFTQAPAIRSANEFKRALLYAGANAGSGAEPPASHVLFEANDLLAAGSAGPLESELREGVEANVEAGEVLGRILYDSVGGALQIVNVLPDGKANANASFGSFPVSPEGPPGLSHAISEDGSRIFWSDGVTGGLYVREEIGTRSARTVQVDGAQSGCGSCTDGGGRFLTASSDGSKAFFTDEGRLTSDSTAEAGEPDLYEYDVNTGNTTDLTVDGNAGEHANVQGVVGSSDDGSYLYFIAKGALAGNANSSGDQAEAGMENLYLRHGGTMRFIAALAEADGHRVVPYDAGGEEFESGDWEAAPSYHTAEVTPDGHSLLFLSVRSLTGYDNEQTAFNPFVENEVTTPLDEVFLYEAESSELRCVSCDPSGQAPVPTEFNGYHPSSGSPLGGFIPITKVNNYRAQPRVISDDGSRVFFDSGEPLVPRDTHGWLSVYEWERDGAGSCRQAEGCVYLLSSGSDPESSYLIGASASGSDVFFVTRARLVPSDSGENDDLYDAHECTSASPCPSEATASGCTGAGCQASPPEPPTFASGPTLSFAGPGNLTKPSPSPPVKCKARFVKKSGKCIKKHVRCKKGFTKKKGRCAKSKHTARQARKPTIRRGKQDLRK